MARKLPDPSERSPKEPVVFCEAARVIRLYNTYSGKKAKRVGAAVRNWFVEMAQEEGWTAAMFVKEVESAFHSGCILYKLQGGVLVNLFLAGEGGDD